MDNNYGNQNKYGNDNNYGSSFNSYYDNEGIGNNGVNNNYYSGTNSSTISYTSDHIGEDAIQKVRSGLARTYIALMVVMIISGLSAYSTYSTGLWEQIYTGNNLLILCLVEFGLVIVANITLRKQLVVPSVILLLAYSVVNGITLSSIFIMYSTDSILMIFFVTAAMFAILAVFGVCTKMDLTSLGTMGLVLLLGVIIATLLNVFIFQSASFDLILTALGLAVFIGITAYDSQKIKRLAASGMNINAVALFGALTLYLDFVNILLRLLRLFGNRR